MSDIFLPLVVDPTINIILIQIISFTNTYETFFPTVFMLWNFID